MLPSYTIFPKVFLIAIASLVLINVPIPIDENSNHTTNSSFEENQQRQDKTVTPRADASPLTQTYINDYLGITFQYPETYTIYERPNGLKLGISNSSIDLVIQSPRFIIDQTLELQEPLVEQTPISALAGFIPKFTESLNLTIVEPIASVKIGNLDGASVLLSNDSGFYIKLMILEVNPSRWLFVFLGDASSDFATLDQTNNAILVSTTFTEPTMTYLEFLIASGETLVNIPSDAFQISFILPEGFNVYYFLNSVVMINDTQSIRLTIDNAENIAHANMGLAGYNSSSATSHIEALLNSFVNNNDRGTIFSMGTDEGSVYADIGQAEIGTRIYLRQLDGGQILFVEATAPIDEFDKFTATLMEMLDKAIIE